MKQAAVKRVCKENIGYPTRRLYARAHRHSRLTRGSLQMEISGPEQSYQPNDDQLDGDDVVQQPRHDKDQYAGEK
jgi:hypothetical protein